MHRGGREAQAYWKTAVPFRQQPAISPAKYQEGKAGVGGRLGKLLSREGAEPKVSEKF